jgi:thiopeptide-type bacteriocin biosynthesis protein
MKNYEYHEKFVLRTPLMPFKEGFDQKTLLKLAEDPKINEAILVASPSLHEQLKKLKEEKLDATKASKVEVSLYKYLMRMHNRCTPFGLFSGCSVGDWGESTSVKIKTPEYLERHTRLDMNYLCALAQHLENDEMLRTQLYFSPNSSLNIKQTFIRYIRYTYENGKRLHKLTSVDNSEYLKAVLEFSRSGKKIDELATVLCDMDQEIPFEEAKAFVHQLIDEQLLVSNLEPSITGDEFMKQIIQALENIADKSDYIAKVLRLLKAVDHKLLVLDTNKFNNKDKYAEIIGLIEEVGIPYDVSRLFQVDISRPGNNISLKNTLQKEIKEGLSFLNNINPYRLNSNLSEFINAFYSRFEDSSVPLLDLMDSEIGTGYPVHKKGSDINPLTRGITIPAKKNNSRLVSWNAYDEKIFKILIKNNDQHCVDLSEENFSFLDKEENNISLAPSFFCKFRMLKNETVYLENAGGSSAINLIGRFAHGNEEIHTLINDLVEKEEKNKEKDTIYAEIVHLPEARTGNILLHPDFRTYEIPFLGRSSKANTTQIPVSDILVSVDPMERKVYLHSRRLGKRIIPRLSSAHNYTYNALPLYHFLCDLQLNEQKDGIYFHCGKAGSYFKRLPRFTWKNIVLAPERWTLEKNDFASLTEKNLKQFRNELDLPSKVVLVENDNELLFDLENTFSVKVFIEELGKRSQVTLQEFLPFDEHIQDNDQHNYTNEFLSFFYRKSKSTTQKTTQKVFMPGSEWLYFKIYCGVNMADQIITNQLLSSILLLKNQKLIEKWFFIRYADPNPHLRLRFKLADIEHIGAVARVIHDALQNLRDDGLVHKVQLDTYKREIERYGLTTMEESEEWFMHDSEATAKALTLLDGAHGEENRWLYACRAMDQLLKMFGLALVERKQLLGRLKESFATEFAADRDLKKQLSNRYRKYKKNIAATIEWQAGKEHPMTALFGLLEEQKKKAAACVKQIEKKREIPQSNLLASYLHMMLNRLFRTEQRKCELIIYDFMYQYYKTKEIITKKKKTV